MNAEKLYTRAYDIDDLEIKHHSTWEFFATLFTLTNITVLAHWQLANNYWPNMYVIKLGERAIAPWWQVKLGERVTAPWWLVKTEVGLIQIGRLERVWQISWEDTPIRKIITSDEVTKSDTHVHAWSEEKLLEYLKALRAEMP